ncbi:MAG: hypothetical protein HQL40_05930 [Alphaproteobacteria bacterium]|nr:hypothetical protein [Alphaproteobacteria bacterium]MBF0333175.1 hypothetical protein [Alphaproteobacteria bacterium]
MSIQRGLRITGIDRGAILPDAGEREGTVSYVVHFALGWGENGVSLDIHVSTREGWQTAVHLACEQVKELAAWLGVAAEREKSGPHISVLY